MIHYVDNLFLSCMSSHFLYHIHRANNRVKMVISKYQNNVVKIVCRNGRVQMSFFCICCAVDVPCSCHHKLFFSQNASVLVRTHSIVNEPNPIQINLNVHLLANVRAFLSQHL